MLIFLVNVAVVLDVASVVVVAVVLELVLHTFIFNVVAVVVDDDESKMLLPLLCFLKYIFCYSCCFSCASARCS